MAHLALSLLIPPVAEPVSLAEAKQFLRVDYADDDVLITSLITAAREFCEDWTHRAFYNQTWTRSLDNFPQCWERNTTYGAERLSEWPYWSTIWNQLRIDLPKAKTQSVESITYIDTGTLETVTIDPDDYIADLSRTPCSIVPANAGFWPLEMIYNPGSVTITFVAGSFGDGQDIDICPQAIKVAIMLVTGFFYNNREGIGTIPQSVYSLLAPYKLTIFEYA